MKKKYLWMSFSCLFIIIGCSIAYHGFSSVAKAKESESWPSTDGIIVSSEMERHKSDEGGVTYSAEVAYEFKVDRETITGNKIKFGQLSTGDSLDASRYLNKYKLGTPVTVYYEPNDPYHCVLEPGIHTSTWFLAGFGMIFALFGTVFMLAGYFGIKT